MHFSSKVVLLTGASGGIGAGLARGLSEQGARLLLSSRSAGDLGRLIRELPYHLDAVAIEADLGKPGETSKLAACALETAGRVDVSDGSRTLAMRLRGASQDDADIYVMINASSDTLRFGVHDGRAGQWKRVIDTAQPTPDDFAEPRSESRVESDQYTVSGRSVAQLTRS